MAVRAQEAGDLAETSRTGPLVTGPACSFWGDAGFWSVAGSNQTVIEGVGGLGSLSSRNVGRVCSRVIFLEEEGEKFQPFLLTSLTTLQKPGTAANFSFCCEGGFF